MFFKEWQIRILRFLWSTQPNGATSGMVWNHLQETMDEPVSRASIINYLKKITQREGATGGPGAWQGMPSWNILSEV